MKIKAFTLAEILITLGIIGIISALTIPTLITNYQKRITVVRLKKAYNIFSNAIKLSIVDNGDVSGWNLYKGWNNARELTPRSAETYLLPYISGLYKIDEKDAYAVYDINGSEQSSWIPYLLFGLQNGMIFSYGGYQGDSNTYILVDLNGRKKPNRLGKDVFTFIISPDKNTLVFSGQGRDRWYLLNYRYHSCSAVGEWCGALILYDNWTIQDDYPW